MKQREKKVLRICAKIMFGVYIIFLIYFLFFAESTGRTFEGRTYHYNLVLFKEIKRFWDYRHSIGMMAFTLNVVGNVAAFVPFGFFLPVIWRKCRSFFYMVFFSFEFSLIVETIQLVSKVGSFDVDDLLLNTIGGAVGYIFFVLLNHIRRKHHEKTEKNQL